MILCSRKKDKKKFGDKTTTVTKEYILNQHKLQNNKCYYCDCEMEYGIGVNRFHNPFAITLERISSDLPHTNSNCVLICWQCNIMKNSKILLKNALIFLINLNMYLINFLPKPYNYNKNKIDYF